jgi:hypothetical protein
MYYYIFANFESACFNITDFMPVKDLGSSLKHTS